MSEVKPYYVNLDHGTRYAASPGCDQAMYRAEDFDRVTAERDALRNEVGQVKGKYDRAVNKVDALQALLTAADEKNDTLTAAYLSAGVREHLLRLRVDVLEGLLREIRQSCELSKLRDAQIDAALKPAEAPRNQCDGCQAGIPVVNGAHRMGKTGGYPDTMSCTAKLYKPTEGGGDEAMSLAQIAKFNDDHEGRPERED